MEGRSPEFMPNNPEPTDDGFSEAKSAKAAEGKGMDTKQVKKRIPASRQGKSVISRSSRLIRPVRTPRPIRQRVVPQTTAEPVELSRKEKIIRAYKQNATALINLAEMLNTIDGSNFRQEEQVLDEIKEKRHLQEELLHALVLEQRHQLTEEAISKEAWNLVK